MNPVTYWLLENWQRLLDTATLAVVVLACIVHYTANLDKHSPLCEVLGFILTGAGAFGSAVYNWTIKVEPFSFSLLTHVGMAFIAVSLIQGRLRALLARVPGLHVVDRRSHS